MKYTEGFTRIYPTLVTATFMFLSFYFLCKALKTLPLGTGYAVWTGIGILVTAILGILLFDESCDAGRIVCILLIFTGVVGLKFMSTC
ncbi:MAG: multidrug efflux SMR transporter [Methanosarcinaceae archaeon]|nr:multidrug efflux SMR transporter [Methanosarcinaceae archaeon]